VTRRLCWRRPPGSWAPSKIRMDPAPSDPAFGRLTNGGHRRADDDDNHGGDFVSKFDGASDPLSWLNRCERCFHVRRTLVHQRVSFAAFYLLDNAQLWFHWMELNGGKLTWPQFVQLVNACFGPPLTDSPISELAMLRRKESWTTIARSSWHSPAATRCSLSTSKSNSTSPTSAIPFAQMWC
jgi:hypothetical protein